VPTSRLVRWGAIGAFLAGVAWAGSDIFALLVPARRDGLLVESLDAIAEVGMLAALVGLHALQAPNLGRLGVGGLASAFAGVALVLVATLVGILLLNSQLAQTLEPVAGLMFAVGLLGWIVGFVLFGIATFRAGVLPRWSGLLLAAYPLVVFVSLPVNGLGILAGFLWLAVGYLLWARTGTAAEQPSRVS
jgi:hypothetical protein